MTLLIFSCNRALQLQTLLRSLFANLTVDEKWIVHVLYAATSDPYQRGYQQLEVEFPAVVFHRERQQRTWAWPRPISYRKNLYRYLRHPSLRYTSNFKHLTEQIIASSADEGIMFLTDDSLFTKPVRIETDRVATVLNDPIASCTFSLRHGLTLRPLPTNIWVSSTGHCAWQLATEMPTLGHWTWRFSVDGHLYPRRALLPILQRLHYANPNSLEGFVNAYIREERPDLFSMLHFDAEPSLIGFILNKVQTYNGNRSFNVSPTYLNEKLLAGYSLAYQYQQPITDFQPVLEAIELVNSQTHDSERLALTV